MAVIFGTMHIVKKAGLESPEYMPIIRSAYATVTAIIFGLTLYLKTLIQQKNDTNELEYDDPTPGSQEGRIKTTVCKYDLSELSKLQKSTIFTVAIVGFMHFKFGYVQPLILQSIMPLMNLYKNQLFQIHVLGKPAVDGLQRPWVPENPFAALTGANTTADTTIATTTTAAPAVPATSGSDAAARSSTDSAAPASADSDNDASAGSDNDASADAAKED
ncbi:phosphate transporter (Pho88) [Coemansia erecta]|uniref:Phosphate transporter (Pho88) n=1 Tax=Coemansia asiatica TaxID=1052880 RepID=A0A9W7XEW0_9FUNG|nr:phosphate transporter (Pho88) [Coemansia asiatica]KAJ2847493.1 phosphate transporter (Pho88) [Coemansia erecta]KAJ2888857.1 phosphate transporter (Pho88) [Coemansia asiatica]